MQKDVDKRTLFRPLPLVVAAAMLFIATFALYSQAPMSPEPDDPEMYLLGLRFINNMNARSLMAIDPTKRQKLHMMIRNDINLNESDLAILITESQQVQSVIMQNGKQLQGDARRVALTTEMQRLSTSLSRSGWNNFQAFVNGPLRRATVITTISHSAQP